MLTFEEAEAMLTPERRSELARCMLDSNAAMPADLTEAERTFFFGLSIFCEYESRDEVEAYIL